MSSSSRHHKKEDDVALADKEMEERANRAKELLSMRYKGLRHEQVSSLFTSELKFDLYLFIKNKSNWNSIFN